MFVGIPKSRRVTLGTPRDTHLPGDDGMTIEVPFTLSPIDSPKGSPATQHRLTVQMTGSRQASWGLSPDNARHVMLQLGRKHIMKTLRDRQPKESEMLIINTVTHRGPCPELPPDISGTTVEVERPRKPVGF